ncbi:sensor domain-containing diguanylate cyclase [Seleniivibrio woodruffii]|uniref:Diguanylate cyclase with GAF sensor n=1 Tax=Seleniivibrio woodruffii TaxID=1078050 RepID=A0A4R1KBD5_9BACT|nr:sensor domain-containing diguanylate cyclase [Seleniivibrio woodruffii]TCK61785.1 diguanylate cyclase with GAF sensor [Seleniivibrio woodruffii]TVZ35100.1 diguanylate cyclase with GAF sensor [Seleniivibrio woodruffii]
MAEFPKCNAVPSSERMLEIIKAQAEISKIGPDLGNVIDAVCHLAQNIVKADGATVEFAEEGEMVYRAVSGSLTPYLGLRLRKETSLSGNCVSTCEMMYCKDSAYDERVDRDACMKVGAVSMLVMPLPFNGVCIGVLKVVSGKVGYFTEDDMCVLSMIADMLGASIHHASRNNTSELFKKATTDYMTGLANRASFYDELRKKVTLSNREQANFGVLMLDMDGLKFINDTFGHQAGDASINEFALRISSVSRQTDTVARLGGDEFAIIATGIKEKADGDAITQKLYLEIDRPFIFEGQLLPFGGSIGYAIFPEDSSDMQALIDIADKEMYKAKRERKATASAVK